MAENVSFYFPSAIDRHRLLLRNPIARIYTHDFDNVENTLRQVDEWTQKKSHFIAGYISYEAGYSLIGLKCAEKAIEPLIDFYVFKNGTEDTPIACDGAVFFDFSNLESQEKYAQKFSSIREQQIAGNTYQVNYTYQNTCSSQGSSGALFAKLLEAQNTPYAAFAQLEDVDILSVSPELFFLKQGNTICSKPMKGTLPLGVIDLDKKTQDKLQAENLMIVDLIRNDLAKLAIPETVRVKNLMAREQYATLQQIVSTVEATLYDSTTFSQIINALFPCGSITGAPKQNTMKIIQSLENGPRGIYTGTIGYIAPNGDMQFNVAIRTLVGRKLWRYGVGGGVVLDSNLAEEWSESILKKRFILSSNAYFYLFETLLIEEGKIIDLEQHIQRLAESANFFGFQLDVSYLRDKMHAAIPASQGRYRLRITLSQQGSIQANTEPLEPISINPRVTWSEKSTDSQNIFIQHKTSKRTLYDEEYKVCHKRGYYDVLFVNEKKQVTEASRHNIFIFADGYWYTPPLEVGILSGIERKKQMELLKAKEKILYRNDVDKAEQVVLTNAVRGRVNVEVEK